MACGVFQLFLRRRTLSGTRFMPGHRAFTSRTMARLALATVSPLHTTQSIRNFEGCGDVRSMKRDITPHTYKLLKNTITLTIFFFILNNLICSSLYQLHNNTYIPYVVRLQEIHFAPVFPWQEGATKPYTQPRVVPVRSEALRHSGALKLLAVEARKHIVNNRKYINLRNASLDKRNILTHFPWH